MKSLYKIFILLNWFFILIGCNKADYEDNVPYYTFSELEKELLIKYIPNQIIVYKNQFNEELHFRVILNENKKLGYHSRGTFSGGGGYLENYFDSKMIRLEILGNGWDEDNPHYDADYSTVNYIFSTSNGFSNIPDEFINGFNLPMWNKNGAHQINEGLATVNVFLTEYNNIQKTSMNVNGILFEKIVMIESNSNAIKNINSYGSLIQNVNKIYYDYDFGIVQFEDIDGKIWKVIYPE